jgi:hypothetical protein
VRAGTGAGRLQGGGQGARQRRASTADRAVRKTGKNSQGDITSLCDDGAAWSPRLKADAIRDIDGGLHTYYVPWNDGRTEIKVVKGASGK